MEKGSIPVFIFIGVLLIISVAVGVYYLKVIRGNKSGLASFPPNQIRTSGLQLTYPKEWIPIFAPKNNSKNVIYFAKTKQDAQNLTDSNFSFKLEDAGVTAVPQGSTVEDYIKKVKPELFLSPLEKVTINGHGAWSGYVDTNKLNYQIIVVTGTEQAKSFTAILITAPDKQMMTEFVAKLPSMAVNKDTGVKPTDLLVKKGFVIDLTSSLFTADYSLINLILSSLLTPQNSTENYSYFLYTESKNNPDNNVGGPNYPKDNYLNNKYYLLTDNGQLTDGVYGTSQVQINLSASSIENLGAYLADPKYCRQDNDCQYRSNYCTIGAYNLYHQFITPWGCGQGEYEGLGSSSMDLQQKLGCKSGVKIKFDSLKCINNSCQTINAQPVCF